MAVYPSRTLVFTLALLASANILIAGVLWSIHPAERTYTYEGTDYPEFWQLPPAPSVALVIEEPSHYPIIGLDAREEWATAASEGTGYMRLGPRYRAFTVSMFHQFHCLRSMRAFLAGDFEPGKEGHFTHCLSYHRQMILCDPDLTLEPPDVLERNVTVQRTAAVHVCNDWRQAYQAMADNWAEWNRVRDTFV